MGKEKEISITEFTPEQLAGWEEYRQALYIQKSKSDDLFEKAITFISSGALGLTLTFHDKIAPVDNAIYVIIIAIGWALLVTTLFLNLISHYQSSKSTDDSIDEIDKIMDYKISYSVFQKNLSKRNKHINNLNKVSITLLGIGLLLIIIYVSINIHYGKTTKSEASVETTNPKTTQTEQSDSERSIDTSTYIPIK
ncbi:hypothetical protein [Psychroflexus lacisalsi]|jgi:preprotein translocase subunit SecG|uniref:Uncharacterized protein n=1 Tax=Psychroflexus lacisalsi TaxID=503928 RepID=A0ABP3VL70_9FLAO|nr:hypothetical protein [Psychroflexus lacisalsi]MBZ9620139.1 hypothetical protein [Psychroflexus lacisalsi]